jgi:hypothetical protein
MQSKWNIWACVTNTSQAQQCSPVCSSFSNETWVSPEYADDKYLPLKTPFGSHVYSEGVPQKLVAVCPSPMEVESGDPFGLHPEAVCYTRTCGYSVESVPQCGFQLNHCAGGNAGYFIKENGAVGKNKNFTFIGFVDTVEDIPGWFDISAEIPVLPDEPVEEEESSTDPQAPPPEVPEEEKTPEQIEQELQEKYKKEIEAWEEEWGKEPADYVIKQIEEAELKGRANKGLKDFDIIGVVPGWKDLDNPETSSEWYFLLDNVWFKCEGTLAEMGY